MLVRQSVSSVKKNLALCFENVGDTESGVLSGSSGLTIIKDFSVQLLTHTSALWTWVSQSSSTYTKLTIA